MLSNRTYSEVNKESYEKIIDDIDLFADQENPSLTESVDAAAALASAATLEEQGLSLEQEGYIYLALSRMYKGISNSKTYADVDRKFILEKGIRSMVLQGWKPVTTMVTGGLG
jgi:hypothetical protein